MTPKISIRLERYGDTGWEWRQSYTDPITNELVSGYYRTNPAGDGLWQYIRSASQSYGDGSPYYEWRQTQGTCQFWLPNDRRKAYDKIRNEILSDLREHE